MTTGNYWEHFCSVVSETNTLTSTKRALQQILFARATNYVIFISTISCDVVLLELSCEHPSDTDWLHLHIVAQWRSGYDF